MPSLSLAHFSPEDLAACGDDLQALGEGAPHRQAVAERMVRYLYDSLRIADSKEPACVLVRCFQSCPYARLPLEYQHAADHLFQEASSSPNMRCLALLATRGSKQVWNDVATSINHQSIPLPSVEVVKRAPMIARLLEEFGVPLEMVVAPPDSPDFLLDPSPDPAADSESSDGFNVFHVESALGSPFIPAQEDFVKPYGVQSVLGMGGLLSDGELFVVLLFSKVTISHETAKFFRALAGRLQTALRPFPAGLTFERLGS